MADITLTAAVRSNLSTLQSTASLISDTQERLATGKKVNSALDNPNSFFTASSLNSRASDLNNLQDDIGQSVSTLEAADKGIQGIDKLLDAAKGKANQALQSKDADTRAKYASEFNELRTQIEDIAKDSGYKGKNLLGGDGNDLLVKFNEDGSSKLNIGAVDYTDLDSEDAAFKLEGISTTVGEVEARDLKQAFTLGEVGQIPGQSGSATTTGLTDAAGTPAPIDGDETVGGTGATGFTGIATGDVIKVKDADGNYLKDADGNDVSFTTLGSNTLQQVGDGIAQALRDAGEENASASISVDGQLTLSGLKNSVELEHETSAGTGGQALDTLEIRGTYDIKDTKLSDLGAFEDGDRISFKYGDNARQYFDVTDSNTVEDLRAAIETADGVATEVNASFKDGQLILDVGKQDLTFGFDGAGSGGEFADAAKNVVGKDLDSVAGRGWGSDELIEESLDQIRQAQLDLRAQASTFGTNLSVVTNRQDFTADLISTLEVGAGKLTLADSNLEGANLAALNTQNSIATSTLSLATQAGQSVLQLIR
ncbi:Flagellin FlgL [Pseudovibrio ascidiaceicola]|uniref:Flagellin FlgL n=1 Tax=Pseudovibrio ascidiaceicola TaxID=285279 RepID=A0A1I4CDP3_9HYPH|nr:hypothetical protein [Pseudovibrio ascidiaceicola]SFK78447.1 Flagellin FlgL [Pseudovibrio ascidiaceicola]